MDAHLLSSLRKMCQNKRVLYVEDDDEVRTQTRKTPFNPSSSVQAS